MSTLIVKNLDAPTGESIVAPDLTLPHGSVIQVVTGSSSTFVSKTSGDGWSATGDFANPVDNTAWAGTTSFNDAAKVGTNAVSTCELNNNANGCDQPTGTLTSPTFKVDSARPHLNFLMSGGNGGAPVGLRVINPANDAVITQFTPNSCADSRILGDQHWQTIDLTDYIGQFVQVVVFDEEQGSCGFVSFDHVHLSSSAK